MCYSTLDVGKKGSYRTLAERAVDSLFENNSHDSTISLYAKPASNSTSR